MSPLCATTAHKYHLGAGNLWSAKRAGFIILLWPSYISVQISGSPQLPQMLIFHTHLPHVPAWVAQLFMVTIFPCKAVDVYREIVEWQKDGHSFKRFHRYYIRPAANQPWGMISPYLIYFLVVSSRRKRKANPHVS